jgi:membrane-associated phospholipid phosphatase
MEIVSLNRYNVWSFDRRALFQANPLQRDKANTVSDWAMNVTIFMPALLFIDKEIRKRWYDIIFLYIETQSINSNMYTWAGPMFTKRKRPFVYYDEIPLDEKMKSGSTDSFFSGHTAWTAGASFFMAKIYADYHPELGSKKFWLYAAALVPPAFVGLFRYKALKHFPTDILVGTVAGAAAGILIPHIHKIKGKSENFSVVPFAGPYSGVAVSLNF